MNSQAHEVKDSHPETPESAFPSLSATVEQAALKWVQEIAELPATPNLIHFLRPEDTWLIYQTARDRAGDAA